jgi:hypothetical protein
MCQNGGFQRGQVLWEQTKHENELFNNRAGFFMLANSFLLPAAAALFTASGVVLCAIPALVAVGLISCTIWVWTSYRHLIRRNALEALLKKSTHRWPEPDELPKPGAHVLMGIVLPLVFMALWIVAGIVYVLLWMDKFLRAV